MRGSYTLLATIFVLLFFCEAPDLANVVVQQKQGDSTREIAEQMAENLRRLPQQLSKALAEQSAQKAKGDRPKLQLPKDKPLGAAGPNRNRKPSPEEDADFIIIKVVWMIVV